MSCRKNRPKCNCGDRKSNARCVYYDEYLPDYSKLKDSCPTLEDTTIELYENQEKILKSLDLSVLGKRCIDYNPYKKESELKVNEAFLSIENEICKIKSSNVVNNNIDVANIDLKCLKTDCNYKLSNINQLIQLLIDEICELKKKEYNRLVWYDTKTSEDRYFSNKNLFEILFLNFNGADNNFSYIWKIAIFDGFYNPIINDSNYSGEINWTYYGNIPNDGYAGFTNVKNPFTTWSKIEKVNNKGEVVEESNILKHIYIQ